MKMTSAPKLCHVSFSSCTESGLPPRFFESHRIMRSGSMLSWMRRDIVGPNVLSWSEPIQMRNLIRMLDDKSDVVEKKSVCNYQLGFWIQVDKAAPIPVPVQIRIPRLNIADAWPTPALRRQFLRVFYGRLKLTKLELSRPHELRRVLDQALGKVALHATYHVMIRRLRSLANDSKRMVFHD